MTLLAVLIHSLCLSISCSTAGFTQSGSEWEGCRDRVSAAQVAVDQPDHDAGSTGMLYRVIEQCGYRPERIDAALCDDLYQQVYLACREDGFEGLSMAAHSWVLIFDPGGPLIAGLRRACSEPAPVSREAFGRRLCGH